MGIRARYLIDETFDEIQHLGQLKYTTFNILFSFFVFIIYKTNAKREKRGSVVVNIHKLNDLIIPDAYPLSLQSDIITNIQECTNLAMLNVAFFYLSVDFISKLPINVHSCHPPKAKNLSDSNNRLY